ncbi:MAG: YfhO family protein [Bacilli bacterium]|nr:YfhO family protein [Bacilli bacterium]
MVKLKNYFKKNYIYYLCFFIPILIFIIGLTFKNYGPFGEHSIMIYDGYFQYPGFANYFSEILKGNESILYSFRGGLGTNFFAIAVYYLLNPTSLLLIFFNNTTLYIYYELTIILKIGLIGLSTSILLKYLKRNNLNTFLFSTAYALISYNIIYYSNNMWFDSLYLLPILIIGLHKLIYENKKLMYLVTLTLTIISNFYIGYMICIFSLIYFIYNYFTIPKSKRRKNLIRDFIILSLCSGLISSFALIPVIIELFMGKAQMFTNDYTKYFVFDLDFIKMFYKLTPASSVSKDVSHGLLNIYCSLFAIIYFILSFFNKKINKKEKIFNLIIILYFILSFSFNLIDYSWQFFQKPIWYPVRYAFIFDIFIILVASKCFELKKHINISLVNKLIISFILSILIFIAYLISIEKIEFNYQLIAIIISSLFILQYIFSSDMDAKIITVLISILFIIEIFFNTIITFKILSVSRPQSYDTNLTVMNNQIIDLIKENDKSFYRAEFKDRHIYNNGYYYGYNGINFFSSVRNNNAINFLDYYTEIKVADGCSINYNLRNPLLNNILGVKYLISPNVQYYEKFKNTNNVYINKDAFSLGYMVSDKIYDIKLEKDDYNSNFEEIISGMLGYNVQLYEKLTNYTLDNARIIEKDGKDVFEVINLENKRFLEYNENRKGFYILSEEGYRAIETLTINGEKVENAASTATALFLNDNESMHLKFNISSGSIPSNLDVYFIPYNVYRNFVNTIKQNEMIIKNYEKDHYIEAKVISTMEQNTLFTTIPYDKSWNIYVDGEKYKYESSLNDAFISLKLNPGEHNIVFEYVPKGLKIGILISIIGLFTSLTYIIFTRKTE